MRIGKTFFMHHIIIQRATKRAFAPNATLLRRFAKAALDKTKLKSVELTIRIIGTEEMIHLNATYRQKNKLTNVLSFPAHLPKEVTLPIPILGDIVICAEVVNREAEEQCKDLDAHWAHMIVHGVCHLLNYDHETDAEALVMEKLEKEIMHTLGFKNPYENGDNIING